VRVERLGPNPLFQPLLFWRSRETFYLKQFNPLAQYCVKFLLVPMALMNKMLGCLSEKVFDAKN
jgi:hypothetical protein